MFGTFRYLLSLLVVLFHLWTPKGTAAGVYAVFAFYVLSGYLMTRVLRETYGFSLEGVARYAANRILRVYPPYYAALIVGITVVVFLGGPMKHLHPDVYLPTSLSEWGPNLTIIGQLKGEPPRLLPPAWSLHVELVFYVLMALGLSRTRWTTLAWCLVSAGYTAWLVASGVDFQQRYSTLLGSSLPFALGAALHDWMPPLPRWTAFASGAFMVHALTAFAFWGDQRMEGFYFSLGLAVLSVAALRSLSSRRVPAFARKADHLLGSLAYSIFLLHWPLAAVASAMFGLSPTKGAWLFIVTLPVVHMAALAVHLGVERTLAGVRDLVRSGTPPLEGSLRLAPAN